jgi:hypothetical protein
LESNAARDREIFWDLRKKERAILVAWMKHSIGLQIHGQVYQRDVIVKFTRGIFSMKTKTTRKVSRCVYN